MFSTTDTVVAIATPPGRGGIGVVRLSGPEALPVMRALSGRAVFEPRRATLVKVRLTDTTYDAIDQAIVTWFPAPASYTGDDVVEISAHGSPVVLNALVAAAIALGARAAEPGEFTLRAYVNGRIDLTQAEAVADLIDAVTPLQARAAFDQLQGTLTTAIAEIDAALFDLMARLEASVDFPEEGYHFIDPAEVVAAIDRVRARTTALLADATRGRLVREGLQVAIIGAPNVGKSSLFNALVGAERAIVTNVPGTTRDLVTETIDLDGLQVTLVDTAGLHDTDDEVEVEGVARAHGAARVADLVLTVVDRSRPWSDSGEHLHVFQQITDTKRLIVASKADMPAAWRRPDAVEVSAQTGDGMERLRQRMIAALDVDLQADRPAITNVRHVALVRRADAALARARDAAHAAGGRLSEEFVLADLQDARAAIEEVSGRRAPDELLEHIFTRFCVGK